MPKVDLTMDEIGIIQNMINLIDQMPTCQDELLDCDMEVYNDLTDKLACVVDGIA